MNWRQARRDGADVAKGKLRLQVLGVFLVWLGLVIWIMYDLHLARQRELATANRTASTLVKVLEAHLHSSIQKVDFRLQQFVDRYQYAVFSQIERQIIEAELRTGLAFFPETSNFLVIDALGNHVYDARGELGAFNIADRDYFMYHQAHRDEGMKISGPFQSRLSQKWVIVLSRRLEDPSGGFIGLVLATLDVEHFQRFYSTLDLGPKGLLALWSSDLQLIARWPSREEWIGKALPDRALAEAIARGELSGVQHVKTPLDGIERLFNYKVAEGYPLVLAVGQAESQILAEWHDRAITYAAFCVLLGGALTVLAIAWIRTYRRAEGIAQRMTAAFKEKSRESRALLDSIPFPAWLLDNDGHFRSVNEAFCRYAGHDMASVLGKSVFELFTEEDAICLQDAQLTTYRRGHPVRQLIWLTMAGSKRPFEFLRVPLIGADGVVSGITGVAWDLSDRYEAEERRRLITHVFDHSNEAIVILDDQRRVVDVNKAVTDLTGFELNDVKGQEGRTLAKGGESESLFAVMANLMDQDGGWHGELSILRKDGTSCPVYCNATPIRDASGKVVNWGVFVTDLSERKASEARLESLTYIDQLTRLPNRQGFTKFLTEYLSASEACAVIFIDVDQLARVNNAFGRQAGDLLLTTTAGRLQHLLGTQDVLGYLGGSLFGVLAAEARSESELDTFIQKLINSVSHLIKIQKSHILPTAAVGIALFPRDGFNATELLHNADVAMHSAKALGQNCFSFFESWMNAQQTERLRLESDLRWALPRQELSLHYQPQVEIATGEIVGFESLLRWDHPELGRIPPDRFIPLAEESKLILPIGTWVLWEACKQAKAWQNDGYPPKVMAVNISAVQLQDKDFVDIVRDTLADSGLDAKWLELEITESAAMENPEKVVQTLEELKKLGVRLSIDDFGTGYSSLAYLQRFPVDKIKIDRSFISNIPNDLGSAAIARMVISIGHELKHHVIAEGVENNEQLEFLRKNGCNEFQGYYCSPPLSANAIPGFLNR